MTRFKNKKVHFIGSEGVSMNMLKTLLEKDGAIVSGSDLSLLGHDAKNVEGADAVVYTAAISANNPELIFAKEHGIEIIPRANLLGEILKDYKTSIAVSGTHGKTTTTGMLWEIFDSVNPTVHIGGNYRGRRGRAGGRDIFITEACEYKRSFLLLKPDIGIILNMDLDHTDCYNDTADVYSAYADFAAACGSVIINNDFFKEGESADFRAIILDKLPLNVQTETGALTPANTQTETSFAAKKNKDGEKDIDVQCSFPKIITFGLNNACSFYATCLSPDKKGCYSFCMHKKEGSKNVRLGKISLSVAGRHNVYNAMAAIAAAVSLGLSFGCISAGLTKFKGTERRMELIGFVGGCAIFSDYAHHPKEIATGIRSARECGYKHMTVVFEPHTYTRTKSFLKDFAKVLSAADTVILLPVYAAREALIEGGDSKSLYDELLKIKHDALFFEGYSPAESYILDNLHDDGIVLFMGAGSIDILARRMIKKTAD